MRGSRFVLAALLVAASPASQDDLARDLKDLEERFAKLRDAELSPDGEIFAKGIAWALRYEAKLQPADFALLKKSIDRGRARAEALAAGKHPWSEKKGKLVRGYRSAVDGSVQPFGLIVPAAYDLAKKIRLDVVLHGSTRPVGLSELRFMSRFDEGDEGGKPPEADFIELHPLGRVENCYRWAGETDVFEAIEEVCRRYAIDRDRIVLRGMSMGASGTWHLGLKHPDVFVALGPWCGYVDTHRFSETPTMKNFVKVGALPDHQEKALHMLDSVDYAANAGVVPAIACMGDKDPFFDAHVLMGEAMKREGLEMVNLIAPNTAHAFEPATQKEQMRRIGEIAAKGRPHDVDHLRFVTWTLKYNRCRWLRVLALGEHYARAEIEATYGAQAIVDVKEPKNVTAFALHITSGGVRVGGVEVTGEVFYAADEPAIVVRHGDKWVFSKTAPAEGKRPGLQGPIDDAFTTPFLCVRGTAKAWNPAIGAWAEANLRRFAYEWHRYFRGELPVKDDTEVTDADLARCNLILFGDPASNSWIAKVLPKMPVRWTKDELRVGETTYAAADHAPALIQPNPLPGAAGRYVVLNSGHTFHEKELALLNYLLFPRLGDWAVLQVPASVPAEPTTPFEEKVIQAGLFNENWK
jgi:hypothetical protein